MFLYEITTNVIGESYERCYIWAPTESKAIEMFKERHPDIKIRARRCILSSKEAPFMTELSDTGWEI